MFSKEDFLASLRHETAVCKHLHSKLDEDQLDYRFGESMRSTLELLRYLTYCAIAPAEAMISGDWSAYKQRVETAEALASKDIPAALDRQLTEVEALLANFDEEALQSREATVPGGGKQPLGAALVGMSLTFLAAYRMQLFLQAKASGSTELGTWNNWGGHDKPVEAAAS